MSFPQSPLNTEQPIRTIKHYVMAQPKCLAYYFTAKTDEKKIINLYTFSRKQRYFLLDWIIAKVKETQGLVLTEMTGEEFYKDFIRKDKERALSRRKK